MMYATGCYQQQLLSQIFLHLQEAISSLRLAAAVLQMLHRYIDKEKMNPFSSVYLDCSLDHCYQKYLKVTSHIAP